MSNFMFAGSVRVITAPGLNGEAGRHKRELSRSQTTRLRRSVAFGACILLPLLVDRRIFWPAGFPSSNEKEISH
jgi:hypothetical protein